jgi:Viral BACON domain
MKQCLRCNRQCSVSSLFCNECEALLQNQGRPAPGETIRVEKDVSALATSQHVAISSNQTEGTASNRVDDIAKRITAPSPGVQAPNTPQPSVYSVEANRVDQALNRLNDAARRIAAAEPDHQRKPKSSRLSPLRDISAEIQRQSTPLPSIPEQKLFNIDDEQSDDLGGTLPDLWPWLNDGDSDEVEAASWSNRTDPLISRRVPNSIESARIEEEDIRRVAAEDVATFTLPAIRKRASRLRILFASLTVLAVLALTIDSVLVSIAFLHKTPVHKIVTSTITGSPTLTLSLTEVTYGQSVKLIFHHFSSFSSVYVTRDMDIPITLKAPTVTLGSYIQMDAGGNANASMFVENTWNPGFHTIEAEDHATRYTAQTSLHIMNAGPTRPPHLVVDTLAIDLAQEPIGANSVRPLSMHNDGSGSITWSANSNSSWLLVAPSQGTFSDNQTISVAGQRANLKPNKVYNGTITITSNVGTSATVQVQMAVLPLPVGGAPVLQVTPPLLSFVAIDGSSNPTSQSLSVSNPGSQPLHWSLSTPSPTVNGSGSFVVSSGIAVNWLSTDQKKGTIAPHATTTIQVGVQSTSLLPGTYTSTLLFTADKNAINNPQSVNVSLTVQPSCSLMVNSNALSFTGVYGQANPNTQSLTLATSASCLGTSSWTAATSASWLTVTPASSQLQGMATSTATVAVNTTNLVANTYSGTITLTMSPTQNTQSILVQLTVQAPPPPGAPIMSISPLNTNFKVMQGQTSIAPQSMTITNTGQSSLSWSVGSVTGLIGPAWLALSPRIGVIAPGGTQQVMVKVRAIIPPPSGIGALPAGQYNANIEIDGRDANGVIAGGSPQIITVNMTVQVPCTLNAPTSNTLTFNAVQGGSNPVQQTETFGATGNCAWPVGWTISSSQPLWLSVLLVSGSFSADGQSASITVTPNINTLPPGTYTTQIALSYIDSGGIQLAGSPQTIPVTLIVTGFTVSGTVNACPDTACTTSAPLANATVTMTDGSGAHLTATADANGNYTFTNVALGAGTISASGSDTTKSYTGTASLTVTGDQPGISVNAF